MKRDPLHLKVFLKIYEVHIVHEKIYQLYYDLIFLIQSQKLFSSELPPSPPIPETSSSTITSVLVRRRRWHTRWGDAGSV